MGLFFLASTFLSKIRWLHYMFTLRPIFSNITKNDRHLSALLTMQLFIIDQLPLLVIEMFLMPVEDVMLAVLLTYTSKHALD